jgi:thiosulfate/3-mercaptopyruvate sulfurtransferase
MGLVPDAAYLSSLLSQTGISPTTHLVVCDDEGGGKAARFIYTLDVIGHDRYSLLNGGLHAWVNEGHPLQSTSNKLPVTKYQAILHEQPVATKTYILDHLDDMAMQIIDARSPAEYMGLKKFADRAGHIPGAINMDWMLLIDRQRNLRLKPDSELRKLLADHGLSSEKATIVYCQTHHRSALTYFVLKYLGYTDVKGYPGSWSDWGNSVETPVEAGQQFETI